MDIEAVAALGTAFSVASSNLLAAGAVRHLGPFGFNRWRLLAALSTLSVVATARGGFVTISLQHVVPLVLSGVVGIVVGDTAVYAAMDRLGPRRAGLLYATNAPMAAVLGALLLGERLSAAKWGGILLVVGGVWGAIVFRDGGASRRWEDVRGNAGLGIVFGLLGGFGQASAALLARPAMAAGADPAAAACIRAAAALAGLTALALSPRFKAKHGLSRAVAGPTAASGLLGMGLGMTLLLFALSHGPVGIVASLASMTPVAILPLIWAATGRAPAWQAWIGAVLAVCGAAALVGSGR